MAMIGQGPYSLLEKKGTEESIRLLSLGPGTYQDAVQITLSSHSVATLQQTQVIIQKLLAHMEQICEALRKVDEPADEDEHHAVLGQCQDFVNLYKEYFSGGDAGSWDFETTFKSVRYLLRDVRDLVENPLYGSAQWAVSALSDYMALHDDRVPPFEALSYTWGTSISHNPMTVNGHPLTVTENLDVALRHLRHATESRSLWVDALCINQEDIEERNSQIQLMSCVYGAASQVIIWLGPTADGSEVLLDALRTKDIPDTQAAVFGYCMFKLMSRPWWLRVWM
jgi:hypothetical protein